MFCSSRRFRAVVRLANNWPACAPQPSGGGFRWASNDPEKSAFFAVKSHFGFRSLEMRVVCINGFFRQAPCTSFLTQIIAFGSQSRIFLASARRSRSALSMRMVKMPVCFNSCWCARPFRSSAVCSLNHLFMTVLMVFSVMLSPVKKSSFSSPPVGFSWVSRMCRTVLCFMMMSSWYLVSSPAFNFPHVSKCFNQTSMSISKPRPSIVG
mmetsp:Transcript_71903/g.168286  ORF Transcript_71903/g.168286 Transcript_71903/m.168286 type:complete len:209 (-) Transcript_71903:3676-4302(-)